MQAEEEQFKIPRNPITRVTDFAKLVGNNRNVHTDSPGLRDFKMRLANRHKKATSSTMVYDDSVRVDVPCELSSIITDQTPEECQHLNFYPLGKGADGAISVVRREQFESPAKIFVRMKAKALNADKPCANQSEKTPLKMQKGLNNTPRKGEIPVANRNVPKDAYIDYMNIDLEGITLSPMPPPGKRLQTELIRRKTWEEMTNVLNGAYQPTIENPHLHSGLTVTGPRIAEDYRARKVFAANESNEKATFIVPKKRAALFGAAKRECCENSPAKTFFRMKEKVELEQREQVINEEVGTVGTRQRDGIKGRFKPSLILSGDEGDHELHQDYSIIRAMSHKPVPSGQSPPQPPVPTEDALLQESPRIRIPKKRVANFQQKGGAEAARANEVHLREWQVKMLNNGLYVDGVRV